MKPTSVRTANVLPLPTSPRSVLGETRIAVQVGLSTLDAILLVYVMLELARVL